MENIRTRIAPSPTGYVHVGTLRTILWDYYLAKQKGGSFIVRIEDTDQERFVEGSVENLLEVLRDLGIEHDEGPVLNDSGEVEQKGEFGPYVQTERLEIYKEYIDKLLGAGDAYHCFCPQERLNEIREQQRATKQTPKYDRHCLNLTEEEVHKKLEELEEGDPHVIRMRIPEGESVFEDAIRGTIKFNNADVDDQVLVKSNGIPTYHLAVVVDDYLMKISHVLRGEEWLPSMPKQIILHKMLGMEMPIYAHVPLILNEDKTKLSKRKGDVSVESYVQKGYLPEALKNFLATLGFNPSGDREIYTEQELTGAFNLSKVNKAGAVMNIQKLEWMNAQYMKDMEGEDFLKSLEKYAGEEIKDEEVRKLAVIEKNRLNTMREVLDIVNQGVIFDDTYGKEMLVWKKADEEDAGMQLRGIQKLLTENELPENLEGIEEMVKGYIQENELGNGNVLWPLRIALSGQERSHSPFELLWLLGKEEALRRINIAIQKI